MRTHTQTHVYAHTRCNKWRWAKSKRRETGHYGFFQSVCEISLQYKGGVCQINWLRTELKSPLDHWCKLFTHKWWQTKFSKIFSRIGTVKSNNSASCSPAFVAISCLCLCFFFIKTYNSVSFCGFVTLVLCFFQRDCNVLKTFSPAFPGTPRQAVCSRHRDVGYSSDWGFQSPQWRK